MCVLSKLEGNSGTVVLRGVEDRKLRTLLKPGAEGEKGSDEKLKKTSKSTTKAEKQGGKIRNVTAFRFCFSNPRNQK